MKRLTCLLALSMAIAGPAAAVEKGSQQVSPFHGSFFYALPIETPPFHGLEPALALLGRRLAGECEVAEDHDGHHAAAHEQELEDVHASPSPILIATSPAREAIAARAAHLFTPPVPTASPRRPFPSWTAAT